MTAETIAAAGSVISTVVVVVGAVAALRQLRHLRASNEVHAMQAIIDAGTRSDVVESLQFIQRELAERLRDPAFRAQLGANPIAGEARAILPGVNYWEDVGTYLLMGTVSERSLMLRSAWPIINTWASAAPVMGILRGVQGPTVGENFEHLAAIATRWMDRDAPREARRLLRMPPAGPPEMQAVAEEENP